ncbi:MAG TPA: PQQ-binding-like beta-propeller repeat protein [Lacunisphaera sp.]|nr:PQQ-binding-like beta-propeller repeat protein [Lacunisphaera sp.]
MNSVRFFRCCRPLFAAALLASAALRAEANTPAADPVEGIWVGHIGTPANQAVLGLKVTRDEKSGLGATFSLDQINYYGEPLQGFKAAGDGTYVDATLGLKLRLDGDRLTGEAGGSTTPVELHRADRMPEDPPVPVELSRGPGPRWQRKLGGAIYAPAALHGGYAYVGAVNGVFNAVKLDDGTVAWTFGAGRAILGGALATDDAVYFACDDGRLHKLNRADGKEVWRYELGDAQVPRVLPDPNRDEPDNYDFAGPTPVLVDSTLYVGSGDGSLHAVDAASGRRAWRIETRGKLRTTVAVSGANLAVGSDGGMISLVERATGKEVWHFDAKFPATGAPAIIGGRLVIGTRGSALYGINLATGARDWHIGFWGSWVESCAVEGSDGLGYIGASDLRRITCFDPKDGRIVWRTDVFGAPWGRPVVTAKFVYDGTADYTPYNIRHVGGVVAVERATGRLAWRWPLPHPPGTYCSGFAASPVLGDGLLVIGGMDGTLYAFPAE